MRESLSTGGPPMSEKEHVYSEAEIPAKLAEHGLTAWYLEDGWLRRKYTTDGWPTTLMLVNAVGYLAEAAWHARSRRSCSGGRRRAGRWKATPTSSCRARNSRPAAGGRTHRRT